MQIQGTAFFERGAARIAILERQVRKIEGAGSRGKYVEDSLDATAVDDRVARAVALNCQALLHVQVTGPAVVFVGGPGERKGAIDAERDCVGTGVGVGGAHCLAQAGLPIGAGQRSEGDSRASTSGIQNVGGGGDGDTRRKGEACRGEPRQQHCQQHHRGACANALVGHLAKKEMQWPDGEHEVAPLRKGEENQRHFCSAKNVVLKRQPCVPGANSGTRKQRTHCWQQQRASIAVPQALSRRSVLRRACTRACGTTVHSHHFAR